MNQSIKHIGIIGGGKMGSGIFYFFSQFDLKVTWYVRSDSERLEKKYIRKLDRSHSAELIMLEQLNTRKANHCITDDMNKLSDCDLVIESITENLESKRLLFNQLSKILNNNAIIATNSSSFLPGQLSGDTAIQNRLIGLHFFYPVEFKNIIELVVANQFKDTKCLDNIANLFEDAKQIVLMQNERNAFLLNRLMLHLQLKAFSLNQNFAYSVKEIDAAVDKYLFPGGIFSMMDQIGLDILQTSVSNYSKMKDCFENIGGFMQLIDEKVEEDQLGIKTHMGFYNYLIVEKEVEYKVDRLRGIAKQLYSVYLKAFNFYVEQVYCSAHDLTLAMNDYLDTNTEGWKQLLDE